MKNNLALSGTEWNLADDVVQIGGRGFHKMFALPETAWRGPVVESETCAVVHKGVGTSKPCHVTHIEPVVSSSSGFARHAQPHGPPSPLPSAVFRDAPSCFVRP